uniref:BZIP domain-containing protein n=1 Tax=Cucumis melo TaxID=3656 RepID=A0A9I9E043_CUCME
MESIAAAVATVSLEEDDWELCNDDGFVYKRKRRRLHPAEAVAARSSAAQAVDLEADENRRRERRRKTLLKVRAKYQREIEQWEVLSGNLREMEERARKLQEQYRQHGEQGAASLLEASSLTAIREKELSYASMVDDLLSQVEAQDALISNISKFCDIAEALCQTEEDQLKQRLIDLPIWGSPRELMASLCDE